MIVAQPDLELVLELPSTAWLGRAAAGQFTDVVVALSDSLPATDTFAEVLRRRPWIRVIAVTNEIDQAATYELEPRRTDVGELSAEALLDLIRGVHPASVFPHADHRRGRRNSGTGRAAETNHPEGEPR